MRLNHECGPEEFHCACTRTQEYAGAPPYNIRLKEQDSYDEFSIKVQPAYTFEASINGIEN